jgi:hypothetical protein
MKTEEQVKEVDRVITGKGSVIRHFEGGRIEIMFANGNFAEYDPSERLWFSTNNKGIRRGKTLEGLIEFDSGEIPCATKTDPTTEAKVMVREDGVVTVTYKDFSKLTQHRDGTRIFTNAEGTQITVEKENYAPIRVYLDHEKGERPVTLNDCFTGTENMIDRSMDGRLCETFLPDKTVVQTFRECRGEDG